MNTWPHKGNSLYSYSTIHLLYQIRLIIKGKKKNYFVENINHEWPKFRR